MTGSEQAEVLYCDTPSTPASAIAAHTPITATRDGSTTMPELATGFIDITNTITPSFLVSRALPNSAGTDEMMDIIGFEVAYPLKTHTADATAGFETFATPVKIQTSYCCG